MLLLDNYNNYFVIIMIIWQTHCENVTIRTKLEYQPDLGYEKLSKSDACAEWLDLQFRPQPSVVLRCKHLIIIIIIIIFLWGGED